MTYIRYAVIGKDTEFSFVPVIVGLERFDLCDACYDLADTPLEAEFCLLGLPKLFKDFAICGYGEYYNPVTGLLMAYEPGEEGFEPLPTVKPVAPLVETVRLSGGSFSLEGCINHLGLNRPGILFTDCEGFWSMNSEADLIDFDYHQQKLYKIVEVTYDEAEEFYSK